MWLVLCVFLLIPFDYSYQDVFLQIDNNVAIQSGYIGIIGFFIYVSLHLIFFSMELHGIRKKNICLNIFSCVIWCIIALEMLGNLLLLLIFSGVIEQYVDNLEINNKYISELYWYSYRYLLLIFTKTFYVIYNTFPFSLEVRFTS